MDLPQIPGLSLVDGDGGLPKLLIDLPTCTAALYLHGAHITEWTPQGHEPVLYLSPQSRFSAGQAIRGGVPIVFPWFDAGPNGELSPAHGTARTGSWQLTGARRHHDNLTITLQLTRAATASRPGADHWTSDFIVNYTVDFGESLTVTLDVDPANPPAQSALHTYFRVGDIHRVSVHGLDHQQFRDKVTGETRTHHGPITFEAETDRIYHHSHEVVLKDPSLNRQIHIAKRGSPHTVVWNPWREKAARLPDLPDDGWQDFVCIESANLSQTLRMCTSISVEADS